MVACLLPRAFEAREDPPHGRLRVGREWTQLRVLNVLGFCPCIALCLVAWHLGPRGRRPHATARSESDTFFDFLNVFPAWDTISDFLRVFQTIVVSKHFPILTARHFSLRAVFGTELPQGYLRDVRLRQFLLKAWFLKFFW